MNSAAAIVSTFQHSARVGAFLVEVTEHVLANGQHVLHVYQDGKHTGNTHIVATEDAADRLSIILGH